MVESHAAAHQQAETAKQEAASLNDELAQAKRESADASQQLAELRGVQTTQQDAISSSEALNESLKSSLATRDRQLNETTAQLAQVSDLHDLILDSQATLERAHGALERRTSQLTADLTEATKREAELRNQLADAQRETNAANALATQRGLENESQKLELQAQAVGFSNQLEQQVNEMAGLSQSANAGSRAKAELAGVRAELRRERNRFVDEMTRLQQTQQEELATQAKAAKTSLVSANIELGHFQRRDADSARKLADLQKRLDNQQQLASAESAAAMQTQQLQREIVALNEKLKSQERDHANVVKVLTSAAPPIDPEQQQTIDQLRSELRQQEQRLIEQESVNQDLVDQLKEVANPATPSPFDTEERKTKPTRRSAAKTQVSSQSESKRRSSKPAKKLAAKTSAKKRLTPTEKPADLTAIKGIGPVAQKRLRRLGIKTYQQIADWTKEEIQHVEEKLNCTGRVKREKWVQQAKKLSKSSQKSSR